MIASRAAVRRPGHAFLSWLAGTAVAVTVLTGCSSGEGEPQADAGVTGRAVEACLAAGAEHSAFPVDGADATTVTVERDDQGWLAVRATVEGDGGSEVLTCTAVPEDDGDVRAASWGVERP